MQGRSSNKVLRTGNKVTISLIVVRPFFISFVQVCKQLEVLSSGSLGATSRGLSEAMGITQHHDSITGTCRTHVANDYSRMLSAGLHDCYKLIGSALIGPKAVMCDHLNVSYCSALSDKREFSVVIYNPLGREETHTVRIPVGSKKYIVLDPSGKAVATQFITLSQETLDVQKRMNLFEGKGYELVFNSVLPALGSVSYRIRRSSLNARKRRNKQPIKRQERSKKEVNSEKKVSSETVLENEHIKLVFSGKSFLSRIIGDVRFWNTRITYCKEKADI